jgi:hypothetical protein
MADYFHERLAVTYAAEETLRLGRHPDELIEDALRQQVFQSRYQINGKMQRELYFEPFEGDYGNALIALSRLAFPVSVKRLRVIPGGVRLLHTTEVQPCRS